MITCSWTTVLLRKVKFWKARFWKAKFLKLSLLQLFFGRFSGRFEDSAFCKFSLLNIWFFEHSLFKIRIIFDGLTEGSILVDNFWVVGNAGPVINARKQNVLHGFHLFIFFSCVKFISIDHKFHLYLVGIKSSQSIIIGIKKNITESPSKVQHNNLEIFLLLDSQHKYSFWVFKFLYSKHLRLLILIFLPFLNINFSYKLNINEELSR